MANLLLFVITTFIYCVIWSTLRLVSSVMGGEWASTKKFCRELAIIALLCLPVNINGNVFTVLGNAKDPGNIFSVFSIYQDAGKSAVSVFGAIIQKAGLNAVVTVGITGYQKAADEAVLLAGLAGYQKANKPFVGMGIVGLQNGKSVAKVIFGAIGYQKAGHLSEVGVGLAGKQYSRNTVNLDAGFAGYQRAQNLTSIGPGMALYQRVRGKDRAFAIWSDLSSEPTEKGR